MICLKKDAENLVISQHTIIARSFIDRAFGLIIRNFGENLDGMVFENCNLIHSFLMRYKFDLVFIEQSGEVVKCYENACPNKIFSGGSRKKLIAIELPCGTICKFNIKNGDFLTLKK